jgi:hypothetical protein
VGFAARAYVQALGTDPVLIMSAIAAALKSIWPFHIGKIVSTGLLGVKTFLKFNLVPRKIFVDKKLCHNWPPLDMWLCMRPL